MTDWIKYLQRWLLDHGHPIGAADGIAGARTLWGIQQARLAPAHWVEQRQVIGALQVLASRCDLEVGPIDGYLGPQTRWALDAMLGKRVPVGRTTEPGGWPPFNRAALVGEYGQPGANQVRATSPYPLRLAWKPAQALRSFSCHEAVREPIEAALADVLDTYGMARIAELGLDRFGGCLNVRKVRGGSRLSVHSWGICIDWDPEHNRLRWGADRAHLARPECTDWLTIWERHGFRNLGVARDRDWMHHRYVGRVATAAIEAPAMEQMR